MTLSRHRSLIFALTLCCLPLLLPRIDVANGNGPDEPPDTSRDAGGFFVHTLESNFQTGRTQIRVLLPDMLKKDHRYPVVYVLPVEAGAGTRWGDGLLEAKKQDLPNKHQAIFATPTFSHLPWYADHPTKAEIRQESHFIQVVVPFVENTYPASNDPADRWLLGFSKSGWGAWSLLLRHPDFFGRAAAWDAPLMMQQLGKYGTSDIFGSQENFDQYRPACLLPQRAGELQSRSRLVLTGYDNFRTDHQQLHSLLRKLKIIHKYRDGPWRKHNWHSGWMAQTVDLLVAP
jgi:S-formylglutathione hydrolase FrmB